MQVFYLFALGLSEKKKKNPDKLWYFSNFPVQLGIDKQVFEMNGV